MTITLTPDGGSPTTLCHGFTNRGVAGYYWGPIGDGGDASETFWQIQPSLPIGADEASFYDRGNGQEAFSFTVERAFSTEAAAELFRLTCPGGFPREGVLAIADGSSNYRYNTAALQRLRRSRLGCAVELTFEFLCGLCEEYTP